MQVQTRETSKAITSFPAVGKGIETGVLVFFYDNKKGVTLNDLHHTHPAGYHSAKWDMTKFVLFEGELQLRN